MQRILMIAAQNARKAAMLTSAISKALATRSLPVVAKPTIAKLDMVSAALPAPSDLLAFKATPTRQVSKAFLITGGTEKARLEKARELYKDDVFLMYSEYEGENELAVILSSKQEHFHDMTFEEAKKLAGSTILAPRFRTSTFGREPRFGIIDVLQKIEIAGLPKAEVLLALYNNASCAGKAFESQPAIQIIVRRCGPGKMEKAVIEINKRAAGHADCHFDYIDLGTGPRPIKASLEGSDFDPTTFDNYHGEGSATEAIERLKAELAPRKVMPMSSASSELSLFARPKVKTIKSEIETQLSMN